MRKLSIRQIAAIEFGDDIVRSVVLDAVQTPEASIYLNDTGDYIYVDAAFGSKQIKLGDLAYDSDFGLYIKKQITPHKGGRDKHLKIRVTENELELIRETAKRLNMSQTDLIVSAVEKLKKDESK